MAKDDITFLVFEQEPIVREDISDTLRMSFSDSRIVASEDFAGLVSMLKHNAGRTIFICSVPEKGGTAAMTAELDHADCPEAILIGAEGAETADPGRFSYLSKPFTSDMLTKAVRNALSRLPSSR